MTSAELQQVKQRFGIIGTEPALNRAIDVAVQVAPTDLSVLITGESGVGKETFPKIIHTYSHRKHGQYIAVNCGAIPEGTIDSELFGHEKGSFTGAVSDRKGYFEVANGGTIFLDEVGELPLTTQVRLLRVLEAGEFIKVGSSKVQKTNVRVVAATNMDMSKAIAEGRFREDLFYRLNSVPVHIPPLRERGNDITLLFRKFAGDFAEKYRMPAIRLTEDAMQVLINYYWAGNVRQLKNITEQISVLEQNREIDKEKLLSYLPENSPVGYLPVVLNGNHSKDRTFDNEREILYQVLFDMKKDMNDLKKLVHDIIGKEDVRVSDVADVSDIYSPAEPPSSIIQTNIPPSASPINKMKRDDIQDTEEYVEETLSLEDVEKEMIKKALERHHNKRKYAAEDLKISERTLYRKIKEYGLE
jgi:transcriptional regulator with PAS, ATPase and Fis domain